MNDDTHTQAQLLAELAELRQQVAELEMIKAAYHQTQSRLQECEHKLNSLLGQSINGIILINEVGQVIEWNLGQERITGLKQAEVIGQPVWDVLFHILPDGDHDPTYRADLQSLLETFLQTGQIAWQPFSEHIIQRPDGTRRVIQSNIFPIQTEQGFMLGSIVRDVTEHQQAQQAHHESKVLYHTMMEHSPAGIFLLDNAYRFINANETLANMLGYSLDELIGLDFRQTLTDSCQEMVAKRYQKRQRGEVVPARYEIEMLRKDGEVRYGEVTGASFIHEQHGVRTIGQVLDITDRKRAEHARAENELRYKGLFEQMNDAVFIISLEGIYLSANQRGVDMLGYTVDELIGKSYLMEIAPSEQNASSAALMALKDGAKFPVYERTLKRKNGEVFPAEMNVALVKDLDGKPLHIQVVVRDITERKQTEQALIESEDRYRRLSELTSDYAYSYRVDPDGILHLEWLTEESYYRITGVRRKEAEDTMNLYHPDDDELVQRDIQKLMTGQATQREYRILTRNGKMRWLHISRYPVWDENEGRVTRFFGAAKDITERKQAEESLRESEEKFRNIVEQANDGIRLIDNQGTIIEWNRKSEEMTGIPREAALGKSFWDVIYQLVIDEHRTPETYERLKSRTLEFLSNGQSNWLTAMETTFQRPDGTRCVVEETGFSVKIGGKPVVYCGITRDLTERKQAERQRLELALEKERSEAMRTLIGNISHDIKTPLTTINTSIYLLRKQTDPVKREKRIKNIEEQVHTLEGFIQDLLALSRLDGQVELHRIPINLNQLIVSIEEQLRPTLESKNIDFVLDFDEDTPPINADQSDMRRALTNLIENAINYTPSDGTITVRTGKYNGEVVVEVSDTGIGINSDDLPYIFDRFYRSKQAQTMTNSGSGLGLAIVQKVIEMHQGEIAVESLPQTGSTFRVLLPAM